MYLKQNWDIEAAIANYVQSALDQRLGGRVTLQMDSEALLSVTTGNIAHNPEDANNSAFIISYNTKICSLF